MLKKTVETFLKETNMRFTLINDGNNKLKFNIKIIKFV